eukprot:351346-Chlamydomonas_euryale.AAC.3
MHVAIAHLWPSARVTRPWPPPIPLPPPRPPPLPRAHARGHSSPPPDSVRESISPVSAHIGAATRLVFPAPLESAPASSALLPVITRRPREVRSYSCMRPRERGRAGRCVDEDQAAQIISSVGPRGEDAQAGVWMRAWQQRGTHHLRRGIKGTRSRRQVCRPRA